LGVFLLIVIITNAIQTMVTYKWLQMVSDCSLQGDSLCL